MTTRSRRTRMDDQKKDDIDRERPPQRNCPKLQTHKVPAYDVEATNGTIKEEIYDLLTSLRLFPEEQKRCRNRRASLR